MTKRKRIVVGLLLVGYLLVVWIVSSILLSGTTLLAVGMVLSACGLTLLGVYVLVARLSPNPDTPAGAGGAPAKPGPQLQGSDEDAEELRRLLARANSELAKSATLSSKRARTTLADLPLYLIVGANGCGKTATFMQSGLDPKLLAGEIFRDSAVTPTRLCNFWFVRNAVVAEASGQLFSEDQGRWVTLLQLLHGSGATSLLRRMWGGSGPRRNLRAVVFCCDVSQFKGIPDSGRLAGMARTAQQRLRIAGEVFGLDFPVYVIFTKADSIPYFGEYFARLAGSESQQILGCAIQAPVADERASTEVYAQAETQRIGAAFNDLYYSLARRRLLFLAREPDPSHKPDIYEFPREIKRLRGTLVQFLVEVFRPNPLQPGPLLRGLYFTGTRQTVANEESGLPIRESTGVSGADATRLLNAEQIQEQIRRAASQAQGSPAPKRERLTTTWTFVQDLFSKVVLADSGPPQTAYGDKRLELYRKIALGSLAGVFLIFGLLFARSFWNNKALLNGIQDDLAAVPALPANTRDLTGDNLRAIDRLLGRLQELHRYDDSLPWRMGFGLYRDVAPTVRKFYFTRFQEYLLKDTLESLQATFASLPGGQSPTYPYGVVYDQLKAYLSITKNGCTPQRRPLARTLTDVWSKGRMLNPASHFDFYAGELERKRDPFDYQPNQELVRRGRGYLGAFGGEERIYRGIVEEVGASRQIPAARLVDYSPKYSQALIAIPAEVQPAFTPAGWGLVRERFKNAGADAGESCVLGEGSGGLKGSLDKFALEGKLRNLYVRNYILVWKEVLAGAKVPKFSGAADAARKLEILDDIDSPVLGLLFMVHENTNFPAEGGSASVQQAVAATSPGLIDRVTSKFGKAGQLVKSNVKMPVSEPVLTTADITKAFQPVHTLFTPEASKTRWNDANNRGYIAALGELQKAMAALAQSTDQEADVPLNNQANSMMLSGVITVKQIAGNFDRRPDGAHDDTRRLLDEPFKAAEDSINKKPGAATAKKLNGGMAAACAKLRPLLGKYPFQPASEKDASLDELVAAFSPVTGELWKFHQQLAPLVAKQGHSWVARLDGPPPVKFAPGFLEAYSRLTLISDALFADRSAQPQMSFTLKPLVSPPIQRLTLTINAETLSQGSKQFNWPGPTPSQGAMLEVMLVNGAAVQRADGGPWGIFSLLADADTRAPGSRTFVLTKVRNGRHSSPTYLIQDQGIPVPAKFEVLEFPNGVDRAFDRDFFTVSCPAKVAAE